MTRLTPWLTAAAIAALTTAPAAAQQPATPTQTPQPHEEQTQPATSTQSADEHISKAKAALDGIPKDAVTGPAASKIADVRRQLSALEKASPKTWATNVTAIDKAITGLTADAAISADVKATLEEVRTHVTAFAATKSGTASPEAAPAAAPAAPPSATPPPTTPTTPPPSQPQPQPPAQPQPAPPTQPQPSTPPPTTPTEQTPPQQPPAAGQADQSAARQHLSEARRVLSEVTQLPAAAQLQGEARTQVAQLITNFNALITAQSDWKDKYNAVEQSLNALIGPSAGSAVGTTGSATPAPAGTSGTTATAGAATTVDQAIKTKLEELRKHLTAFNAAMGGATVPQL